MKKNIIIVIALLSGLLLGGCGTNNHAQKADSAVNAAADENAEEASETVPKTSPEAPAEEKSGTSKQDPETAELPDGIYTAEFTTDSSMFHVNETCEGRGTLTVENGEMTIHITLGSKKILNLYPGSAEDAAKEGAELLLPTEDTVTYSDGMTEEVYGFDVPVPVLETEFDLALIGTKGKWYDHKVSVSDPIPVENKEPAKEAVSLEDGTYSMEITFEGGSGKAEILSPVSVTAAGGTVTAAVQWDSPNYDYMIVDGEKYLPVNTEGNSTFEIPVLKFEEPMQVIGDTVAMSKPHEIEYTLTFHSDTAVPQNELRYAKNFKVDYYEGGNTLLTITADHTQVLIVPENGEVPQTIDQDIVVLKRPVKDIYLVASSAMDMFSELDALDSISFSGQKEDGWFIEAAREEMHKGNILYAGKYNKPDYELLVSNHCAFAIENRMISHSPEVAENLENFGIPVMIDYSSYESHPLGRVEWVKFYGALLGKEEEAEKIFADQEAILERVSASERTDKKADKKTDKTVAFFFITSNGMVQVRQSSDYVPKMIELAGGSYIFPNLGDPETKRSTMNMQAEEFYAGAKDADFLIYNSSIDGGVSSVEELLDKCGLLADFKAVENGNVWCTTNDMYQHSLAVGYFIEDIHAMIQGENDDMNYLYHLD